MSRTVFFVLLVVSLFSFPMLAKPHTAAGGAPATTGGEVGDPAWGFRFAPPPGWTYQKNPDGALLGHNTVPGRIMVIPHQEAGAGQVRTNMEKGLVEEGTRLTPVGKIKDIGNNAMAGDFTGVVDGQAVKARGIGTFSPHGGGAYIIAIALPGEYGPALAAAAEAIARGMTYPRLDSTGLVKGLAGTWKDVRSSGQTTIQLSPNGDFSYYSDSSAGGTFRGAWSGEATGTWGATSAEAQKGRWKATGTPTAGTIHYQTQDGTKGTMTYRVNQEKGKTYWNECYFDGRLYAR